MRKTDSSIPATPTVQVIERMFTLMDVLASKEEAISLKDIYLDYQFTIVIYQKHIICQLLLWVQYLQMKKLKKLILVLYRQEFL